MNRRFLIGFLIFAASGARADTSSTPPELLKEARSLATEGKFDEAIKDLSAALFQARDLPGAWTLLGFCQETKGDSDAAVKSYQSALDANSEDTFAKTHLLKLVSSRLPPEPQIPAGPDSGADPAPPARVEPQASTMRQAFKPITVAPYALSLLRTGNLDSASTSRRYGFGIEIVRRPRSGVGLGVDLGHRSQLTHTDMSSSYIYYGSSATAWSQNDISMTFLCLGPRFNLEFGPAADLAFSLGLGGAYWTRTYSTYERYYDDWSLTWYDYSYGPVRIAGTGAMLELGSDFRVHFSSRWGLSFKMQYAAVVDNPTGLGVGGSLFWLP